MDGLEDGGKKRTWFSGDQDEKEEADYYAYPVKDWDSYLKYSKVSFQANFGSAIYPPRSLDDYERIRTLGQGAFGRVMLVVDKSNGKYFAMKIVRKEMVIKFKQIDHALNEMRILESMKFPFCVHLETFFKDNSNLYFILPFIQGGEMFTMLRKFGRFPRALAQFYASQVLLALEYLHALELVYRDLKPENILIDMDGYLRLTDFGFCKRLKGRTYTLCGTPEYIAPEILRNKGYGFSCDWWAFGILIYEFSAGVVPFSHADDAKLYEKSSSGKFKMHSVFTDDLKDLLKKLIEVDTSRRLGCLQKGATDIRSHPYFTDTEWLDMVNKRIKPPFIPARKDQGDASNFENYQELAIKVSNKDKFAREFEQF